MGDSPDEGAGTAVVRGGVVLTLVCGGLALGTAGLVPAPVCLAILLAVPLVGLGLPRWAPALTTDTPRRTVLALASVGSIVALTAVSGVDALGTGHLTGPLGRASTELVLPPSVPIGLLAALAGGALVAVALELGDRRGVQSALILGVAVIGLSTMAAPGSALLPALIGGWPAALYVLTRLSGARDPAGARRGKEDRRGRDTGRSRLPWRKRDALPSSSPSRRPPPAGASVAVMSPGTNQTWADPGATGQAVAPGLGRWGIVPVLASMALSLVILGLLIGGGVASGLTDRGGGRWDGGSSYGSGDNGRSSSGYLGGEMDLNARGALRTDPLFEVPADSPTLWRAGTLDLYTGQSWLATAGPDGLPGLIRAGDTVTLDPAPRRGGRSRTDEVRLLVPGATQVLAPGDLAGVRSAAVRAGAGLVTSIGDRATLVGRPEDATEYTVLSEALPLVYDLPSGPGAASGDVAGLDDPRDPRWTNLPPTVPARVLQLGRTLVAGAPDRVAAAQAIEDELDERMTYRLDSPVPPDGADAVDDVLFVSHSGFCEQFATASAVLLRAAGVPARVAVGFAGGEDNGDGTRTLRRSDAHAWVEVWIPGQGWVSSDPTPAAQESRSWWRRGVEALTDALRRPEVLVTVAVVVLLLGVAYVHLRRRRANRDTDGVTRSSVEPELAAAFGRLEEGLRAAGRPRAPSESPAGLARRLAGEHRSRQLQAVAPVRSVLPTAVLDRPRGSVEELAAALDVLERALYSDLTPSRQESLDAAAAIDAHVERGLSEPEPTPRGRLGALRRGRSERVSRARRR